MSRDPGDRRHRRRLFVYRSSDSLTPPTIQPKCLPCPSEAPFREQGATDQWQISISRHWGSSSQEGLLSTPLRGGASAAHQKPPSLSTPSRARASPSEQLLHLASPLERTCHNVPPAELRDLTCQVLPCRMSPPDGRPPLGESDGGVVSGASSSKWGVPGDSSPTDVPPPGASAGVPGAPPPTDVPPPGASAGVPGAPPPIDVRASAGIPRALPPTNVPALGASAGIPGAPPPADVPPPVVSSGVPPPSDVPPPGAPSSRWGLVPLFNSVRSKLESFAEIFLSPMKSRQESQHALHSEPMAERQVGDPPGENDGHPAEEPPDSALCSPPRGEAGQPPLPAAPPMDLQLKIQICSPGSALCRPPLQRCLSCPLLPHGPRRHSLEGAEQRGVACTAGASNRRRHSVGTIEEYRKVSLASLTCLRKEKHPFALRPPRSPAGIAPPRSHSSPPSCSLDDAALSTRGGRAAEQSPAPVPSDCKERKVSVIQIRKRVAKPEGSLTPLGLPKRIRLQKDDFSLEEIYTNQNYHTPTENRKFETIFEEPAMKGGALILTSQRPLRRTIQFKDSGAPRRRRRKGGRGGGRTRSTTNSRGAVNIDLLLRHKLDQLEVELQHEEEAGFH